MKRLYKIILLMLAFVLCFAAAGCSKNTGNGGNSVKGGENVSHTKTADGYYQITPEQAHGIMVRESDYIILDVRTESEYREAHIPNAVLLPDTEILDRAGGVLPDKDKMILVYCRSGRRSKNASAELAAMGYINVYEFGGIIDWTYTVESAEELQ